MTHRAIRLSTTIALFVFVSAAGVTFAGEVPESARSQSMSIRPEFLEGAALVFRFPQKAATLDSRIFGFSESGYSGGDAGLGLIGRSGRHGFFLLGQETPRTYAGSPVYYQGGWAFSGETVDIGTAFRGTFKKDGDNNYRECDGSGDFQYDYNMVREQETEGSAGLSIRTDRVDFDLAVDYRYQKIEKLEKSTSEQDTTVSDITHKIDGAWGAGARVRLRLSGGSSLVAVGDWGRPEQKTTGSIYDNDTGLQEVSESLKADLWSAGLALTFSTDYVDWIALSSMIRVTEDRRSNTRYWHGHFLEYSKNEEYWFALSLRHEIVRDLIVRAGTGVRYGIDEVGRDVIAQPYRHGSGDLHEEAYQSFSWGASYHWKNILLDGSMNTMLDIDRLFLALDAHIFF